MFRSLIAFSLQRPFVVVVLALLVVGGGAWLAPRMPVDVFPELNAPTVVILTESPGLAADEVEQYVTLPLETSVRGLPAVRRVRSASAIGLSLLWVEFDWGEDIYRARTLVAEKLAAARELLPADADAQITPITSITGEIMLLSVSSPDRSRTPMELRTYAEFELRNQLMAVPGIAQVVAIGGELAEYQVLVRQQDLQTYDLSLDDVVTAARSAHTTAGAGYLTDAFGLELPVRQSGRVTSVQDIRDTVIRRDGAHPVTIGHVAEVQLGATPPRGTATEAAQRAVVLSVQKSPGTNTLQLTAAIDAQLEQLRSTLPSGVVLNPHVVRQSDFIERSLDNLLAVLRDAAIFVAVILVLFLLDFRTTLITLTALPLSLGVAFLVLWAAGLTINVMTLGGLAVAIGELVDDAIIDVENVFRRLRENAALPAAERRSVVQVVFAASNEIRSSVVFATVIICMVFVPLLFLQGLEGRFFRPLGISYIVATLASLVTALTVTPMLCRALLGRVTGGDTKHGHDGFLVRWLKARYRPTLELVMRRGRVVLAGSALATVLSLGIASTFGSSFLPEFHEGTFTVFVMAPPGTSLIESDRLASGIERQLCAVEGVRSVVRRTGRAERDEHAEPVSSSEIEVSVLPDRDKRAVRAAIDKVLASVPGVVTSVGQPIEHRLSHVLSGTPAAIAVVAHGDDLAVLRRVAKQLEGALRGVPGTRDVTANREVMITSLPIRYRPAALSAAGLSPRAAAEQVQTALAGTEVTEVQDGLRRIALVVRLHPDERRDLAAVGDLVLRGMDGALVRLEDVADVGLERSSNLIARENGRRKAVVSCNVADGYNLGQVAAAVRAVAEPIVTAAGCQLNVGGQFEAQQSASRTILWMGALVVLVMLMLIHTALGSLRAALLVMVNLPLSLIGGIAAIYLTESPSLIGNTLALFGLGGDRYQAPVISIASMVGFITLFGIAVRNGILLVRRYLDLLEQGTPLGDAIVAGSMDRLVPILMTALTAALGLLPIVFAAGEPGSEILAPLSVVVLGGLLSSTFLNLVVVPAGFFLLFRGHVPSPSSLSEVLE
ncbi:MAG: efflux RND transporter permease subunit [Planctomycetes bacterium]|nr:efflux RND transporter permease subunit [Planctomycetota bacterium]